MTSNAHTSPRSLVVYPHLHRNSQCGSCPTVIPGDICFNCGRVSTLLITSRPPHEPTDHCPLANQSEGPAQKKPRLQSRPFVSQYDQVQALVLAHETARTVYPVQRAFDRQFSEVDEFLEARAKLADVHTLAVDDGASISDRSTSRTSCSCCCPSDTDTLWSGTSTASNVFDELGTRVVERWLEEKEQRHSSSDARLTRRGVDCRVNLGGTVCEWVIFL